MVLVANNLDLLLNIKPLYQPSKQPNLLKIFKVFYWFCYVGFFPYEHNLNQLPCYIFFVVYMNSIDQKSYLSIEYSKFKNV